MKKLVIASLLLGTLVFDASAQKKYKIITTIESIVPMGLGRSRIIENTQEIDAAQFTTQRTDGKDSKQGDIKRSDAMITSVLNTLSAEGWELFTVVSGVESDAGKDDGNGIFITRYVFRK